MFRIFAAGVIAVSVPMRVTADEQMRLLETSGTWAAMAHSPSMTAPPDVCIVASPTLGGAVAFRSGDNRVELRVSNSNWALPNEVEGSVVISVNQFSKTLTITANTEKSIAATIPNVDLVSLFGAMDKGSAMTVTAGKSKPVSISLAGSMRATNAFRTCARISGAPSQPGSNPFQ